MLSYIRVIRGGGMVRHRDDPKEAALREARCLNPRPEAVADEAFTAGPEFFDARDLVQVKYEMVRRVRAQGQPVSGGGGGVRVLPAVVLPGGRRRSTPPGWPGWSRPGRARGGRTSSPPRSSPSPASSWTLTRHCAAPSWPSAIEQRFGIRVHPRSVERALGRAAARKAPQATENSGERAGPATSPGMSSCASRCSAGMRAAGGWAWACCKTAGSPAGCRMGRPARPRTRTAPGGRRPCPAPGSGDQLVAVAGHHGPVAAWPRGGKR